ncbi:hypothetical protein [Cryobacterium sp. 10C3]|uniref:hypothetical protein n=1 Tax=Cryobacterium sp. 10C3 TaxID=3048577 RepID=UPI002AB4A155|nr:hypothetical protein [Cryobacterium sp. 10C3]MDY7555496.1 hypothetical protein [Cryobacterium sp. 10C3]
MSSRVTSAAWEMRRSNRYFATVGQSYAGRKAASTMARANTTIRMIAKTIRQG